MPMAAVASTIRSIFSPSCTSLSWLNESACSPPASLSASIRLNTRLNSAAAAGDSSSSRTTDSQYRYR